MVQTPTPSAPVESGEQQFDFAEAWKRFEGMDFLGEKPDVADFVRQQGEAYVAQECGSDPQKRMTFFAKLMLKISSVFSARESLGSPRTIDYLAPAGGKDRLGEGAALRAAAGDVGYEVGQFVPGSKNMNYMSAQIEKTALSLGLLKGVCERCVNNADGSVKVESIEAKEINFLLLKVAEKIQSDGVENKDMEWRMIWVTSASDIRIGGGYLMKPEAIKQFPKFICELLNFLAPGEGGPREEGTSDASGTEDAGPRAEGTSDASGTEGAGPRAEGTSDASGVEDAGPRAEGASDAREESAVEPPAAEQPTDLGQTQTRLFHSITLTRVETANTDDVLSKTDIHATSYNGEAPMTTSELKRLGLEPKEKVTIDGKDILLSSPYDIGSGRLACVGYVQNGDRYIARSFYRSNSTGGLWRLLAGYEADSGGKISWYGKGHSEESVTLPSMVQRVVCNADRPVVELASKGIRDAESVFARLTKCLNPGGSPVSVTVDTTKTPVNVPGKFELDSTEIATDKHTIEPEKIKFDDPADEPNFGYPVSIFETTNAVYGKVTVDVYLSQNGKYRYLFCHDAQNRAWIAGAEVVGAKVNSSGVYKEWVKLGNLQMPAFEYSSQVDAQYRGQGDPTGHYVDTFEKYLSKVPLIQRYRREVLKLDANGKRIVAPTSGPSSVAPAASTLVEVKEAQLKKVEAKFKTKIEVDEAALNEFINALTDGREDFKELFERLKLQTPKDRAEQLSLLVRVVGARRVQILKYLSPDNKIKFNALLDKFKDALGLEAEAAGTGWACRVAHVKVVPGAGGQETYYWDDENRGIQSDLEALDVFDPSNPSEDLKLTPDEVQAYEAYKAQVEGQEQLRQKIETLERQADSEFRDPLAERIAGLSEDEIMPDAKRYEMAAKIFDELMGEMPPTADEVAYPKWDKKLRLFAGAVRVESATRPVIEGKIANMILDAVPTGKGNYATFKTEEMGARKFKLFQEEYPGVVDGVDRILVALLKGQGEGMENDAEARSQLILKLVKAIETRGAENPEDKALYLKFNMLVPNALSDPSMIEALLAVLKYYEQINNAPNPKVWTVRFDHNGANIVEGSEVTGPDAEPYWKVDAGHYTDVMNVIARNRSALPSPLRELDPESHEYKTRMHSLLKVLCKNFKHFQGKEFSAIKESFSQMQPAQLAVMGIKMEELETLFGIYEMLKGVTFTNWGPLLKYIMSREECEQGDFLVPKVKYLHERKLQTGTEVVVVDVEEKMRKIARRLAEEKYEKELGDMSKGTRFDGKVGRYIPKFWKLNFWKSYGRSMARQGWIDKFEQDYLKELREKPDFFDTVMSGEEGGAAAAGAHEAEVNAIVNRFEMGAVSEGEMVGEAIYNDELDQLTREYLSGVVDEAAYARRARDLVYSIRKENVPTDDLAADNKLVATNVVEKMKDLRLRHMRGLANLDLDNFRVALRIGKARNVDVHSEVDSRTYADALVGKIQRWTHRYPILSKLAPLNPTTGAIWAYGLTNVVFNMASSRAFKGIIGGSLLFVATAPAALPAGIIAVAAGVVTGGTLAYVSRRRSVIMQEAHKNRREALGYGRGQAGEGTFERDLEDVTPEKVGAVELITRLDQAMAAKDPEAVVKAVAEIEKRNEMTFAGRNERNGGKVDLIKFTDQKSVERERTAMLAKAGQARNWLKSTEGSSYSDDDLATALRDAGQVVETSINEHLTGTYKRFTSFKRWESGKSMAVGALFGAATSTLGYLGSRVVHGAFDHFANHPQIDAQSVKELQTFVTQNHLDPDKITYTHGEMDPASIKYLEANGFKVDPIPGATMGCPPTLKFTGAPVTETLNVNGTMVPVTHPSDFTIPPEAYTEPTHPTVIDRAWFNSHFDTVTTPGSSISGVGMNGSSVIGYLEGKGVLTHGEVSVESDGTLSPAAIAHLQGKGFTVVDHVSGTPGTAPTYRFVPPSALSDADLDRMGFPERVLGKHWHNGTAPAPYEDVHELHLLQSVDTNGHVVLDIHEMLKGGHGSTRTVGGPELNMIDAFDKGHGQISLYAVIRDAHGHQRAMPFNFTPTGEVDLSNPAKVAMWDSLWDRSVTPPVFKGEFVMCGQQNTDGMLSSVAKIDGNNSINNTTGGGLMVVDPGHEGSNSVSYDLGKEMPGSQSGTFKPEWNEDGECGDVGYRVVERSGSFVFLPPIVVKNPLALEALPASERSGQQGTDSYGEKIFMGPDGKPVDMEILRTLMPPEGVVVSSPWSEWNWGNLEPLEAGDLRRVEVVATPSPDDVPPIDAGPATPPPPVGAGGPLPRPSGAPAATPPVLPGSVPPPPPPVGAGGPLPRPSGAPAATPPVLDDDEPIDVLAVHTLDSYEELPDAFKAIFPASITHDRVFGVDRGGIIKLPVDDVHIYHALYVYFGTDEGRNVARQVKVVDFRRLTDTDIDVTDLLELCPNAETLYLGEVSIPSCALGLSKLSCLGFDSEAESGLYIGHAKIVQFLSEHFHTVPPPPSVGASGGPLPRPSGAPAATPPVLPGSVPPP
ncbi:MAG: hypothetical protein WCT46_01015, partial [Candidatus Gracilibacteria bacterium]